jgi:hypothetical protein
VALDEVQSRLGGAVYQGPGLAVVRCGNGKIVEFSGYRADQLPR